MQSNSMRSTDCGGCDPDLVYHEKDCPLAGELRGRLWLRDAFVLMAEDAVAEAYERGRSVEAARAESRVALGLPLSRDADG